MRSTAVARIKREQALRLAAEGLSFEQIAREVGYSHRGSAHRAVFKALEEHEVEDVAQLRAMEVARLDALQAALWPKVEKGDVAAIAAAVRIVEARARISGLVGARSRTTHGPQSLVMPG
jgi:hypothetical protein